MVGQPDILTGNQEVAYEQFDRKAPVAEGAACAGVARVDGSSRIWRVVSGQARGPVPARAERARPDHLPRLRARALGGDSKRDAARATIFLHMAPLCRRSRR